MHTTRLSALALAALAITAVSAQAANPPPSKDVTTADAVTPTADGKQPDTATPSLVTNKPGGYVVVASGSLSSPAHTQRHGQRLCPNPLLPLGGGVFVQSTSTAVNVNSSDPNPLGWEADVNNNSSSATTFTVYAICGNEPKRYRASLFGGFGNVSPFSQLSNIDGTCFQGSGPPLSGGERSDSTSLLANINSSLPTPLGWRSDANNASSALSTATTEGICGKLKGYHVVMGLPVPNLAGQQTPATALCGTGVPVGGGALSSASSTAVNVNSSYPVAGGWKTYENNASGGNATLTPYVVCAG